MNSVTSVEDVRKTNEKEVSSIYFCFSPHKADEALKFGESSVLRVGFDEE